MALMDTRLNEFVGCISFLWFTQEQPYVMLRNTGNFSGNERYEGFCIDLLREIASMVGFTYRIELVPDGKYGVYDYETGEWNGIVRQLMDKVCLGWWKFLVYFREHWRMENIDVVLLKRKIRSSDCLFFKCRWMYW